LSTSAPPSTQANSQPALQIKALQKSFNGKPVIRQLDLTINGGEFFTILGPSGCGKTTVLRCIAGLEYADSGEIFLCGENISAIPPEHRHINTVFQSYALFPHMNVYDNVAFGLRMAKVNAEEIPQRVNEALAGVRLEGFAKRKPHELSGGQQQRVAIARAIINRPRLLLLDECLSALDYKLRQEMQNELKQLQRRLNIPFIYVTHDQEEALSMSDRIMVMRDGNIEQIGNPRDIYEAPANLFVAQFIGEINVFNATVTAVLPNDVFSVTIEGKEWQVKSTHKHTVGEIIHVMLRPEDLRIEFFEDAKPNGAMTGHIVERNYKGMTLDSVIRLDSGREILASEFFDEDDPDFDYRLNQKVSVNWVHGWEVVLPIDNGSSKS
jgi:spermidine/putrescine transport system ATP-binding protein